MSKKKHKKDETGSKFLYNNVVKGIIFILISIIGICGYGPVGKLIGGFSVFLVGVIYPIGLICIFILGLFMIIKRETPSLFSTRLIGCYIIVLAGLTFLHLEYITKNNMDAAIVLKETFNNLLKCFNDTSAIANSGGGMLGALFSLLFVKLFSVEGTKIIIFTMLILGILLLTDISLYNCLLKIKNIFLKLFKKKDVFVKVESNEADEETEKIIISSINELAHVQPKEMETTKSACHNESLAASTDQINYGYKLPPVSLLKSAKNINNTENVNSAKNNMNTLLKVLEDFEILATIKECHIGPTVTQYEMELKAGTKVSKLLSIQREIALALAAKEVRIQAPIPGKNTIGIEVPNKVIAPVSFKEIMSCLPEVTDKSLLTVGLGKDIMARVKYAEINSTPHLLIAGSTGSGKSVCVNCMIASLLMRTRPDQVKLVMVDPKKVELGMYNGIPHLLCPVVTDPKKASIALKNIVSEMERRYDVFEKTHNKNITTYNEYCETHSEYQKLPYIVVIIDELADLMLVAAKEVEDSIMRITQMARAAGIHLIVATQRPSTDVITGIIKANIPSRLSFAVSSGIDSRTILDMVGAEKLLGKGDMLFLPMGENTPIRIQGAYVSEEELQNIVDFVINQQKATYDDSLMKEVNSSSSSVSDNYSSAEEYDDPLYMEIVDFAVKTGKISASLIQRKYRLGYNRAARIVDLLEERGIIGPQNGSKPREVLVKLEKDEEE